MILSADTVYGMIGGLLVLQVTTFIFFLRNINPEYRATFYDFASGNDRARRIFEDTRVSGGSEDEDDGVGVDHEDLIDERKISVFSIIKHKWSKIEEDICVWVTEKIPEWQEMQPEW